MEKVIEKKKASRFKIFASLIFVLAVLAMYLYVNIKGDLTHNALSFACVGACFLFSFLFIRLTAKKILVTLALGLNVVADYFLVLMLSDSNKLIGVCLFCGVQFCYVLYTLTLSKGIGLKIVNIAIRVALCLLVYFLLPNYLALTTLDMIALMYIINCAVTILILLIHVKKEWVLLLGLFLLLICDIVVGLTNGAVGVLGLQGGFVDAILNSSVDIAFVFYIPAEILIALSSVWEKH